MVRKAWLEDEGAFVFYPTLGGRPIGSIGLHRETGASYSLGYMIGPDHWGQGYTTEMARAVCRFGFKQLRLPAITAVVSDWNEPSKRVLAKTGFRPLGGRVSGYSQAQRREVRHDPFVLHPESLVR
jgi:RimJ/RimL family protein N-acetyltransferase